MTAKNKKHSQTKKKFKLIFKLSEKDLKYSIFKPKTNKNKIFVIFYIFKI